MPIHVERIALVLLLSSAPLVAQSGELSVEPEEQAQRDGLRRSILRSELADETQALAQAQRRKAERAQAGDVQGVAEAEQALTIHQQNLAALRSEIEHASAAVAVPTAGGRASKRSTAGRPGQRAPRWWDVYDNPPPSGDRHAGRAQGAPAAEGNAGWNVYQGGPTP